jgi:HTH-like domain
MSGRGALELTVADLVRLTHPDNWLRHPSTPRRFHRMMAAVVVLMAVLALAPNEISRIRRGDYARGPRGTLLIRGRNWQRTVPVVAEVAAVLDALVGTKAGESAELLFKTTTGRAFNGEYVRGALKRAGDRLGHGDWNMVDMIRKPAISRLLKRDNQAAEVLLGFVDDRCRPAEVKIGPDRMRRLVDRCNPLKGRGRELVTAPVAVVYIVPAPQTLPPIPSDEEEYATRKKLPDNPDIEAMRRASWPKKGHHICNSRRRHRLKYFPSIYPLIMIGAVSTAQIAKLYRTTTAKIEMWTAKFPSQYDGRDYRPTTAPRRLPDGAREAIIIACAEHPEYGSPRITRALAAAGIEASEKGVARFMREMKLTRVGRRCRKFDGQCEATVRDIVARKGRMGATAMLRELGPYGISMHVNALRKHMQRLGLVGGLDAPPQAPADDAERVQE